MTCAINTHTSPQSSPQSPFSRRENDSGMLGTALAVSLIAIVFFAAAIPMECAIFLGIALFAVCALSASPQTRTYHVAAAPGGAYTTYASPCYSHRISPCIFPPSYHAPADARAPVRSAPAVYVPPPQHQGPRARVGTGETTPLPQRRVEPLPSGARAPVEIRK